jgi:hypothetical protein
MNASATRQPPPETIFQSFRWRPLLVSGIPMRRDSRALAADRPIARFHEKPPKPIRSSDTLRGFTGRATGRESGPLRFVFFRTLVLLRDNPRGIHVLIAGARYLAAHAPTVRSQDHTFQIARRLSRGERSFEESSPQTKHNLFGMPCNFAPPRVGCGRGAFRRGSVVASAKWSQPQLRGTGCLDTHGRLWSAERCDGAWNL